MANQDLNVYMRIYEIINIILDFHLILNAYDDFYIKIKFKIKYVQSHDKIYQ